MSTINERVKELRKCAKLNEKEKMTMERFGLRIGVGKTAISKIELGENGVSEQMFKAICREFDVNPDWLRDGTGPMFIEKTRDEQISAFINDALKDEPGSIRLRFITALSQLTEADWARIADFAEALVDGNTPAVLPPASIGEAYDQQADEKRA